MLTERGLTSYAHQWVRKTFNIPLKDCPIYYSGQLGLKTAGRYQFSEYGLAGEILINKKYAEVLREDELLKVLEHELTHHCLRTIGKPYCDEDIYLQGFCIQNNIPLKADDFNTPKYTYECNCKTRLLSTKFRKQRVCKLCNGRLVYKGISILK